MAYSLRWLDHGSQVFSDCEPPLWMNPPSSAIAQVAKLELLREPSPGRVVLPHGVVPRGRTEAWIADAPTPRSPDAAAAVETDDESGEGTALGCRRLSTRGARSYGLGRPCRWTWRWRSVTAGAMSADHPTLAPTSTDVVTVELPRDAEHHDGPSHCCGYRPQTGPSSHRRRRVVIRSARSSRCARSTPGATLARQRCRKPPSPGQSKTPADRSSARVSGVIVTITRVAPTGVDPVTSRFSVVCAGLVGAC